jgi:hypothetical protein
VYSHVQTEPNQLCSVFAHAVNGNEDEKHMQNRKQQRRENVQRPYVKESGGSDFILLADVRHVFIARSSSAGEIEDTAF